MRNALLTFCCAATPFARAQQEPELPEPARVHVTGMLLDERYEPAAGVVVAAVTGDDTDPAALAAPLGTSGADGRFAVDVTVPKDTATWLVLGGKPFATHRYRVRASEATVDLQTVALAPGFTATGRVRDERGRPLAGARVDGSDLLDSRSFLRNQRYRLPLRCSTSALVPENGIFRLPGMVRSAGEIRVRCDGYLDAVLAPVALGSPLDVTLREAPTVRGRVVDAAGGPLAGVTVRAGLASAKSGDDGAFALALREAHVTKVTALLRRDGDRLRGESPLSGDGSALELRLAAAADAAPPGELRVRARGADGAEVAAFTAWTSWNPQDQLRYRPDALLLRGAQSEGGRSRATADGEARVSGPSSTRDDTGIVFVHADGHGWGRAEVGAAAVGGDPVVVTLPRPGTVRGRVVDPDGKPVAGIEVIPTQNLADDERRHYLDGFRAVGDLSGGPWSTRTDDDGGFVLTDVPPGKLDVFAFAPNRAVLPSQQVELNEGATVEGVTFTLPANRTLRGRLTGAMPRGLWVRPHWHRPNMWSSGWLDELDDAVPVAADGAFVLPDLPPLLYQVEALLPAPPRGGGPIKLTAGEWNAATAGDDAVTLSAPAFVTAAGSVAGDVPWQRLAVQAVWVEEHTFDREFAQRGPIALLGPDRTFRLLLPQRDLRLVLFDPFSGIAIAFQDVAADALEKPVAFAGRATPLALQLADDGVARPCTIAYEPTAEHWPLVSNVDFVAPKREGMRTEAQSGADVPLWLPAPSGTLAVTAGGATWTVDVETLHAERVTLEIGPDRVSRRD